MYNFLKGEFELKKILLLVALALTACASTDDALMRESAGAINKNPAGIQLRNVDRGATSVKWEAVTQDGVYECSGDDMLRRVHCFPKK